MNKKQLIVAWIIIILFLLTPSLSIADDYRLITKTLDGDTVILDYRFPVPEAILSSKLS